MNKILISALGFSSLLIPVTAQGATACKGMAKDVCEKHEVYKGIPACRWMSERNTASGTTVKAHCRGSGKSVPADAVKIPAAN